MAGSGRLKYYAYNVVSTAMSHPTTSSLLLYLCMGGLVGDYGIVIFLTKLWKIINKITIGYINMQKKMDGERT